MEGMKSKRKEDALRSEGYANQVQGKVPRPKIFQLDLATEFLLCEWSAQNVGEIQENGPASSLLAWAPSSFSSSRTQHPHPWKPLGLQFKTSDPGQGDKTEVQRGVEIFSQSSPEDRDKGHECAADSQV